MKLVKVTTQAELDAALKASGDAEIWCIGAGEFWIADSAQVTASGSAQVTASGSAQVRAYGSAQVRAYGSAQVRAYGSAQVTASEYVAVTAHGTLTKIDGGVKISVPALTTAKAWCAYHGVTVTKGIAIVYKAVAANYHSARGGDYTPGTVPSAADWDGGKIECGGGLHFSPRPCAALAFAPEAATFVACPVRLADMRAPKADDSYPEKIKAKGCAGPVWAVDIHGERV